MLEIKKCLISRPRKDIPGTVQAHSKQESQHGSDGLKGDRSQSGKLRSVDFAISGERNH